MMDFFFFLKTLLLTLVLVLFMQIQVGEQTLEKHTMGWVQNSMIVSPLQDIAKGAGKMVTDATHKISASVRKNFKKTSQEKEKKEKPSAFRWTSGMTDQATDSKEEYDGQD